MVIALVIFVAIALKAARVKSKNLKKQLVISGQSMLAFAVVTAIWINTENIVVVALSLIMAVIIALNRVESKERTILEVVLGAIIGILICILVYGLTIFK